MRILIVKPVLPWPPNQGTKRVTVALARSLAAGNEITIAAPVLSRADLMYAGELSRATGSRVVSRLAPHRRSPLHRLVFKAFFVLKSRLGGHSPRALYS